MFNLTALILALYGYIFPIFSIIYLFCKDYDGYAWGIIAATLISYKLSKIVAYVYLVAQMTIRRAWIIIIPALLYQSLLTYTAISLTPERIWWVMIPMSWIIGRHPMQDILNTTQKHILEQPFFYASNPGISLRTNGYSALTIYVTGYASIAATIYFMVQ